MDKSDLSFTFRKNVEKDVRVYIGKKASKKVIGVLEEFGPDRVFIVCDSKIAKLYAEAIEETISTKYPTHIIAHEPEETNKSLQTIVKISDDFFAHEGTSKSVIIALGGGITGNMAGFFASIVFRGIRLIHIPTTLLAQVDSAADVKQSVNSSKIKNSIGSFKAPDAVIIDPMFLKSLDAREIRAGLGEAVKHGIAQDMNFVEYILACDKQDLDALHEIAARAISLKIEHWKNTPTIWNDRHKVERLTHLGHTTGKILEMIHVDYLTHGEAIAHGMVIESYMSHLLGHLELEAVEKIHEVLSRLKLLFPLDDKYTPKGIVTSLYHGADKPVFALLQGLGNPKTISTTPPENIAQEAVNWYFNQNMAAKG